MDNFYIARINTKGEGVVNLSKISEREADQWAENNGWYSYLVRATNRKKEFFKDSPIPRKAWRKPGAIFYGVADMLVNDPEKFYKIIDIYEDDKRYRTDWTWGKVYQRLI
jgi:hypothetical protein